MSNISRDAIWDVVKKTKTETLLNKKCRGSGEFGFTSSEGLYADPMTQVNALRQKLGIDYSQLKYANLSPTKKHLETVAEIFIYLNICPGIVDSEPENGMERWFKSWFMFYKDLFETQPLNKARRYFEKCNLKISKREW